MPVPKLQPGEPSVAAQHAPVPAAGQLAPEGAQQIDPGGGHRFGGQVSHWVGAGQSLGCEHGANSGTQWPWMQATDDGQSLFWVQSCRQTAWTSGAAGTTSTQE